MNKKTKQILINQRDIMMCMSKDNAYKGFFGSGINETEELLNPKDSDTEQKNKDVFGEKMKKTEAERAKEWRENNSEKVRAYAKMRYARDKDKILAKTKEYNKNNGYAYDKEPHRRESARIRRATRHKYPLEGQTCIFCPNKAEHRHHTTEPIEIHKFIFLCKDCHKDFHDKLKTTYLEANTSK